MLPRPKTDETHNGQRQQIAPGEQDFAASAEDLMKLTMDKGSRKTPGSRILLPQPKTDETHNGQRQQKSRNAAKLAAFALGVAEAML